jgi:hypothetical protein
MNSFPESLTVPCFSVAKNGDHQTLCELKAETARFDERGNLIGPPRQPQEKFVKFFTISLRLM